MIVTITMNPAVDKSTGGGKIDPGEKTSLLKSFSGSRRRRY